MNSSDAQARYNTAYRQAVSIMDQEWLAAGKTRQELSQEKQLVELFDSLLASGCTEAEIDAAWAGKSADEILCQPDISAAPVHATAMV